MSWMILPADNFVWFHHFGQSSQNAYPIIHIYSLLFLTLQHKTMVNDQNKLNEDIKKKK